MAMSGFLENHRVPLLNKNADFQGVAAGGTATARLPVGTTFLDVLIIATVAGVAATRAQVIASFNQVRFLVDGKEKVTLTGTQFVALVEFYETGSIGDTGLVWWPFQRPWMQEVANQLAPAYGMVGKDSFQIEIDLDAAASVDGLKLSRYTHPIAENLGSHIQVRRITPNFGATGDQFFDDLPKDPRERLYAMHIQCTVANLARIQIIADDAKIIDTTPAQIHQRYKYATHRRTPQTGFVHLDFCNRGLDVDALPLSMKTLQMILTWENAAPNAFPIIMEVATSDEVKGAA